MNKIKSTKKRRFKKEPCDLLAGFIILFHVLFFIFIGFTRHYGYMTSLNDLGHFDQAVWGATQNGTLLNSHVFNYKINHLGFHFTPILYVFSPLYKVLPTAGWLITAQAFCTAISAWPIYLLAKRFCLSNKTCLLWVFIYLLNPYLQNGVAWDFHTTMIALPFISFGIYYLFEHKFYPTILCSVIIMCCMEHFGIMVIGFGLLWYNRHKEFDKAAIISILGILHFLFVFKFIMPLLSPTGEHLMLCNGHGHFSRYTWIGTSSKDIFLSILKSPHKVIYVSLIKMGGLAYIILLLVPFIFLPFIGLPIIIPTIADLAANILSSNGMPRLIFAYHSSTLIPFFCASAIYGSTVLNKFLDKFSPNEVAVFALTSTLVLFYIASPYPLPMSANFWEPNNFINFQESTLDEIKTILPQNLSVSAQGNIGAHFTHRELIYLFPNMVNKADAIVLKLQSPTKNFTSTSPTYIGSTAHHLQMKPEDYLDKVLEILSENNYGIIFWKDNWLVLKKGHADIVSPNLIKTRIIALKKTWPI